MAGRRRSGDGQRWLLEPSRSRERTSADTDEWLPVPRAEWLERAESNRASAGTNGGSPRSNGRSAKRNGRSLTPRAREFERWGSTASEVERRVGLIEARIERSTEAVRTLVEDDRHPRAG